MAEMDLLIRGGALGIMALMTVLLAGQAVASGHDLARRKALAIAVSAIMAGCYLLISSPSIAAITVTPGLGATMRLVLIGGAILAPLAISWLVLEIFFDHPSEQGLVTEGVLALALLVVVSSLVATLPATGPLTEVAGLFRGGLALVLYCVLIILAIRSGADDLVPARRRFRRVFVGVMALTGVVITALEISVAADDLPPEIYPVQAMTFLILSGLFGRWVLGPETPLWPATDTLKKNTEINASTSSSGADNPLVLRILQLMEQEFWRREGLTIGALAVELSVPEHRLRRTINGDMGHRNFSALINGYRIDAACAALDDVDRADTTVLEIAYECGFASLGPFNRAFRSRTGQSPTEYRKARR